MIADNLPILVVVIPLLAAPLAVLLWRPWPAWALATAATWATLAISLVLLGQVMQVGGVSYALGGWAAPWGIAYRIDAVNGFVLLIIAAVGSVVMPYARRSVAAEVKEDKQGLFYASYLLCLAGLLGVAATGDAFNLFVFLEISSLATYTLISLGKDRRALTAAFRYLMLGTIGATFIVIGVGLLYMATGSLNMNDIGARLPAVENTRTVFAAFAFITVGASLKLALFPLHMWLPSAYTYAPSAVTAFIAATSTKVGVYILLRFTLDVFGVRFTFEVMGLELALYALALAGMFTASLVAVFQVDVKRLLAYSSVAQIGYMVLGIALANVPGLAASLVHLFNHAVTKAAMFMALGNVAMAAGTVRLGELDGIARRMPWTMGAFVLGGISLIGLPPTAGFISKWYLVVGALERDLWPVAALIVASSLIAVAYVWRVVEAAYFREPTPAAAAAREAPLSMLVPTWLMAGACLWFGLDATTTMGTAERAARLLLEGVP